MEDEENGTFEHADGHIFHVEDYFSLLEYKIVFGLIVSCIILLNGFVIIVSLFCRSLREKPYNYITMSLSFTDFIVGCSIRPMISMQDSSNFYGCVVAFSIYITGISASGFHLLLITLVRMYAFNNGSTFIRKIEKRTTVIVVFLTWVIAGIVDMNENFIWLNTSDPVLAGGCNFASLYKINYRDVTRFHSLVHILSGFLLFACNICLACKLYCNGIVKVSPENLQTNPGCPSKANLSIRSQSFSKSPDQLVENNGRIAANNNHVDMSANVQQGPSFAGNSLPRRPSFELFPSENITQSTCIDSENVNTSAKVKRKVNVCAQPIRFIETDSMKSNAYIKGKTESQRTSFERPICIKDPQTMARTRHIRAIVTLMVFTVVHVIFTGPFYMYLFVWGYFVGDSPRCTHVEMVLMAVAVLNSFVNPIVYILRIQEFRQALLDLKNKIVDKTSTSQTI